MIHYLEACFKMPFSVDGGFVGAGVYSSTHHRDDCDAANEPHSRGVNPPAGALREVKKPPKKSRWRRRYNLGDGDPFYYLGQNNHQRSHSTNIACRNRATSLKIIRGAPPSRPSKTSKYPPTRPMLRRSASHDDIKATRRL